MRADRQREQFCDISVIVAVGAFAEAVSDLNGALDRGVVIRAADFGVLLSLLQPLAADLVNKLNLLGDHHGRDLIDYGLGLFLREIELFGDTLEGVDHRAVKLYTLGCFEVGITFRCRILFRFLLLSFLTFGLLGVVCLGLNLKRVAYRLSGLSFGRRRSFSLLSTGLLFSRSGGLRRLPLVQRRRLLFILRRRY